MSKAEILERFRQLPFAEQCGVMQGIQDEFLPHFDAEYVARFTKTIERVCCHPERRTIWDRVRAEGKANLAGSP